MFIPFGALCSVGEIKSAELKMNRPSWGGKKVFGVKEGETYREMNLTAAIT